MTFDEVINISPFSLNDADKEKMLTARLVELTKLHQEKCNEYERILHALDFDVNNVKNYKELPFLPVRLFKELEHK